MERLPKDLVIAHRGTTFWAPEETEAAMRWARSLGVDFLECDLQRTKDGYLVALHDEKLMRTTNVEEVFPDRMEEPVSSFTLEELWLLDAGTWFNIACPERARPSFVGLDILTLEDVCQIAMGRKIKRTQEGRRVWTKDSLGHIVTTYEQDLIGQENRPGLYLETKVPALFPGIEKDLKDELSRLGVFGGNTSSVVNGTGHDLPIVLQTFSKESLKTLFQIFGDKLPICFLLWRGDGTDDLNDDSILAFELAVKFGKDHGAAIIGPSIGGAPNNYHNLLDARRAKIVKNEGMSIHAYSFDTEQQMKAQKKYVDGMFTNRADLSLRFYGRHLNMDAQETLQKLGY